MENHDLKEHWLTIAAIYADNALLIDGLWKEIEKKYTSKSRHYHNLTHLSYMFEKVNQFKSYIEDYNTLAFSIFYHDFIYNAKRSDNEAKSAEAAHARLVQLGVPEFEIAKIQHQILATKSHMAMGDTDTDYLVDVDLAILGDDPKAYNNYSDKIRKEYAIYPDFLYKPARKKVLKHFLSMDSIFKTSHFVNLYEEQARKNLKSELDYI